MTEKARERENEVKGMVGLRGMDVLIESKRTAVHKMRLDI